MVRCVRKFFAMASMLLLGQIGAQAVYAQPLGIGSPKGEEQPQYNVLSSQSGRFVFGQISGSSKDQFMLDTATGRLWRIGESGKVGMFLKAVPYMDAGGACTFLPDKTPDTGSGQSEKK